MKAFKILEGPVIGLMRDHIDTDIIIPKQYLKSVRKTGFGEYAFAPWRYHADGSLVENFVLNQPAYRSRRIMVTGENFGCGSSREHAAWALQDYGLEVIIAGSFSDIFYNNWLGNGHLPLVLPRDIRERLAAQSDTPICVDLERQTVRTVHGDYRFTIPPVWRERLLAGEDSVDITMRLAKEIEAYEKRQENGC